MEVAVLARTFNAKWSVWWPKLKPLDKGSQAGRIIPSADETAILDAAAKSTSPYLLAYLTIAFRTGMRAGEVRKLRWDRFMLTDSQSTSYVRVGESKTKASEHRAIPMDQRLWATMLHYRSAYKSQFGDPLPELFVFPFGQGKRIDCMRPLGTIKTAWQRLKKDLKIDYRLHDARHSLATSLAVAGVPEAKRRYLMGHVNENVIKRYTHLQAEECRADLERALSMRENSGKVPTVGRKKRKLQTRAVN